MGRVDYALVVFAGVLFGLLALVALLGSVVADVHDLSRAGWVGVAVVAIWVAGLTTAAVTSRRAP